MSSWIIRSMVRRSSVHKNLIFTTIIPSNPSSGLSERFSTRDVQYDRKWGGKTNKMQKSSECIIFTQVARSDLMHTSVLFFFKNNFKKRGTGIHTKQRHAGNHALVWSGLVPRVQFFMADCTHEISDLWSSTHLVSCNAHRIISLNKSVYMSIIMSF